MDWGRGGCGLGGCPLSHSLLEPCCVLVVGGNGASSPLLVGMGGASQAWLKCCVDVLEGQ